MREKTWGVGISTQKRESAARGPQDVLDELGDPAKPIRTLSRSGCKALPQSLANHLQGTNSKSLICTDC